MAIWQDIYIRIKDSLSRFSSKEFLVFVFFLLVSSAFWFLSSLNEAYDYDVTVKLSVVNVPENIVITDSLPDSVRVTLHDKGYELINYSGDGVLSVELNFSTYAKSNGVGTVSVSDVQRQIQSQLQSKTTTIKSIKADRLEFYFNTGQKKRVPVLWGGTIEPKSGYYISNKSLLPDSVTILAAKETLDTINAIYTTQFRIDNLDGTFTKVQPLQHLRGVKCVPTRVSMKVETDQLTELVVDVPVEVCNVPEGLTIKTFPAKVSVKVAVGMNSAKYVTTSADYTVVGDYNDIANKMSDKLPIKLRSQHKKVVKATLQVNKVDYLIEKE